MGKLLSNQDKEIKEIILNNSNTSVERAEDLAVAIRKEYHPIMQYINKVELEFLNKPDFQNRSIETKLTQVYTLYMAAYNSAEISWDEAFYGFADFTAKLLKIR